MTDSDTVRVSAHDLHRLLLEFRAQLERGDREPGGYLGGWHHGVDYDRSFERLADIIDARLIAAGGKPDRRTRCQHSNPVYTWPDAPLSAAWFNVQSGAFDGNTPPRLRHLAAANGAAWKTLCGFTFVSEDKHPSAAYPRCGACAREQRLRGVTVVGPGAPPAGTTVTWDTIAAILEPHGAKRRSRDGSHRAWDVPSPTGGTFSVEVTLRPRWCSLAVDRIRTTDRREETARPWLQEHVWPYVDAALLRRKRAGDSGILPAGRTFAGATPVDRCDVPRALAAWLDAEKTWGLPEAVQRRRDLHEEEGPP